MSLWKKQKNINVFEREGTIGEEYVISHYTEELGLVFNSKKRYFNFAKVL